MTANTKEYANERNRLRRAAGVCLNCDSPRCPESASYCDLHRRAHSAQVRTSRPGWTEAQWRRHYEALDARRKADWPSFAAYMRERTRTVRQRVFDHYGAVCPCCGEDNPGFLTLDHIDNDGARRRREGEPRGGNSFWRWVVQHGYPAYLRIQCFNRNCGRAANGGVCPHVAGRE